MIARLPDRGLEHSAVSGFCMNQIEDDKTICFYCFYGTIKIFVVPHNELATNINNNISFLLLNFLSQILFHF